MHDYKAVANAPLQTSLPASEIPGLPGKPAFRLKGPFPSAVPVVIAVPHAGRAYAPDLLSAMRNPGLTCHRLEDRLIDTIASDLAARSGATIIVADAPRAMIDLNRDPADVDWEMIAGASWESGGRPAPHGARASGGLGLVPRRLGGVGEIWKRRLNATDLKTRIDGVHTPYHRALDHLLRQVRRRWGVALLLDFHSMPPLTESGGRGADIVLGDRFGASCGGAFVASGFDYLSQVGLKAAYNRPYAGGYVLNRHGRPSENIHAMQIEVCRSLYLDSRLFDLGKRAEKVVEDLSGLVAHLVDSVTNLRRSSLKKDAIWRQAAE